MPALSALSPGAISVPCCQSFLLIRATPSACSSLGSWDVKTSPLSNAWTQVYTVLQEESEAQGLPFERAWRT